MNNTISILIKDIIDWCNHNQGFTSMIFSLITIIVSLFIMYKSNKITKRQNELEKNIALRQEDIQKRQLKVDTYPYRVKCWEGLFDLREVTETLRTAFNVVNFQSLSVTEVNKRLQPFYETYKKSIIILIQATNVFPSETYPRLLHIKLCVENNTNIIAKYRVLDIVNYTEKYEKNEEEKIRDIMQFSKVLNVISQEVSEVLQIVEKDLFIADFHTRNELKDKE